MTRLYAGQSLEHRHLSRGHYRPRSNMWSSTSVRSVGNNDNAQDRWRQYIRGGCFAGSSSKIHIRRNFNVDGAKYDRLAKNA